MGGRAKGGDTTVLGRKKRPFVSAVIVAAGSAARMEGIDKQLAELGGMPVVIRSVMAFEASELVDEIIVVTREESVPEMNRILREFDCAKVRSIVAGGKTRQQSVFSGVATVSDFCEYIAVHDGARPLVQTEAVDTCIRDAMEYGAAILSVPVKDTIKAAGAGHMIERTVERTGLFLAQTPQVFELAAYREAMQRALDAGKDFTDDSLLMEADGQSVYLSRGHYGNIKITTPDDLVLAQALLEQLEGLE